MIRPFDPIAALKTEHRDILSELNLIERDLRGLGQGEETGPKMRRDNLNNAMKFLTERLELHAQEEDEALFPALLDYSELEGEWQLAAEQDRYLTEAYRKLQETWDELQKAQFIWRDLPDEQIPFLVQHTLRFIGLLREHIRFEEEGLFIFATTRLSDEQKTEIARKMVTIRHRHFLSQSGDTPPRVERGAGIHRAFSRSRPGNTVPQC